MAFYNNKNLLSVYSIKEIRGLLDDGNFNVTEYLKSLKERINNSPPATTGPTPRPPGPVNTETPLTPGSS